MFCARRGRFSVRDVAAYAEVSGDRNLYLAWRIGGFDRGSVVHGMLVASLFPSVISSNFAMVARGELGAELPIEEVPLLQGRGVMPESKLQRPLLMLLMILRSWVLRINRTLFSGTTGVASSSTVLFVTSVVAMASTGASSGVCPLRSLDLLAQPPMDA